LNNFIKRTLTGCIFGLVIYGSLIAGRIGFVLVYSLLMVIALLEFLSLDETGTTRVRKITAVVASLILFGLLHGYASGMFESGWLSLLVLLPPLVLVSELYTGKGRPFKKVATVFLGLVYVALPLSLLNFLVYPAASVYQGYYPWLLAGVLALIMVNDTAAYLFGVPFGRNRLFASVSPKKSWEGTIGGGALTIAAAWLMGRLVPLPDASGWLYAGMIVIVFGIYGDLVESMIKRELGVKDSGTILPGHGGVLDRIDAWLLVVPAIYVYLILIN